MSRRDGEGEVDAGERRQHEGADAAPRGPGDHGEEREHHAAADHEQHDQVAARTHPPSFGPPRPPRRDRVRRVCARGARPRQARPGVRVAPRRRAAHSGPAMPTPTEATLMTTPDWTGVLDDLADGRVDGARRRGGAPRRPARPGGRGPRLRRAARPHRRAPRRRGRVRVAGRGAARRARSSSAPRRGRSRAPRSPWTASRARSSCRRTTPATTRCRTASPRRSAPRSRPPATRRRASSRRSRRSPPAPAWPATGATTSPTCPALGSYLHAGGVRHGRAAARRTPPGTSRCSWTAASAAAPACAPAPAAPSAPTGSCCRPTAASPR